MKKLISRIASAALAALVLGTATPSFALDHSTGSTNVFFVETWQGGSIKFGVSAFGACFNQDAGLAFVNIDGAQAGASNMLDVLLAANLSGRKIRAKVDGGTCKALWVSLVQ